MAVSIEVIKQLREMTQASVSDCKSALEASGGDILAASEILKKRGLEIAAKKAARAVNQGRIESYIHTGNKIGVIVEINCETDFVARNEEFARFAKDVAMQAAATEPRYVKREEVPPDILSGLSDKDKEEYFKTHCLLSQPFIKDPKVTMEDYVTSVIARCGENIVIRRFCRFRLGEDEI